MLLDEACRICDRLDQLDAILARREDWVSLRAADESGTRLVVVVDGALAEARQQANALRGLVAELRQATAKAGPAAKPRAKGGLGDLVALADRRRSSAG